MAVFSWSHPLRGARRLLTPSGRVLPSIGRDCALFSGARLLWPRELKSSFDLRDPPIWAGVLCGIGIGFLSGLTGTGGGIFLSPLLLFLGWSDTRTASGVAAVFILCNSIAGLLGNLAIVRSLPPDLWIYAIGAGLG
nr:MULTISPECIES: TSUP family transporter [unclassified Bradyrhizobium]